MDPQLAWGTLEGGWRKGPWTPSEDALLIEHVNHQGEGRWNSISRLTGLKRSGKSCRLRWVNYLRPDLKRGKITPHEEAIILELHALWGNRWSAIARSLPGRTDNEIKNYWRTHFKKGPPSKKAERARARLLQQQQEINQHEHQKQQEAAMRDQLMPQAEAAAALAQDMQEMACLYPMGYMAHGGLPASDDGLSDGCMWGSLWNLDDVWADGEGGCGPSFLQQDQVLFC